MTTILLVDDDPHIRTLILETLAFATTCEILTASDGREALAFEAEQPDLLLLDVNLEGELDGFAVCEQTRGWDPRPEVIFLSGRAHDQDVGRGLAAGACAYLTKPFSPMELIDKIQTILALEAD